MNSDKMERPKLYDKYLNWCNVVGDDSFENETLDVLRECMNYENHLREKKGKVIRMIKN